MAKTTAVARPKVALPSNYEDQVANDIASFKSRMSVTESSRITVGQDKMFKLTKGDGEVVKAPTCQGIIVDFSAQNRWYEFPYDPKNSAPPTCFAVGFTSHKNLTPSDNAPEKQCESCSGCSKLSWEKDAKGGWIPPDCSNEFHLALIAPDDNGEGKLMALKLSRTAVKDFEKYINSLSSQGKAPYQVITEFSFDAKSDYASVRCAKASDVPTALLGNVMAMRDDAVKVVSQEPNTDNFEELVVAKRLAPKGRARKAA